MPMRTNSTPPPALSHAPVDPPGAGVADVQPPTVPGLDPDRDWRLAAACISLPEQAVLGTDREAARSALAACARCPITERCLAIVDPERTWFDGVSGGRLWRNGKEVRVRARLGTRKEQS